MDTGRSLSASLWRTGFRASWRQPLKGWNTTDTDKFSTLLRKSLLWSQFLSPFFPSAKINSIKPNFTLHAAEAFSRLEVSRSLSLLRMISRQPGRLKKCFDLVYSCIRFFKWPQLCCSINVQTHDSSMGTISQGSGVFLLQPMSIQTANPFWKYHFHFFFFFNLSLP